MNSIQKQISSFLFIFFLISFNIIFAKKKNSNSSKRNTIEQSIQYYNQRNYSACVDTIESNLNNNLSDNEMLIYAECLFQIKKLKKSAIIYNMIISKKNNSNSIRAARRIIDIYKLGETNIPLDNLIQYLKNQSLNNYLILDILPLLLENNQLKYFLTLYKQNPIYLSKEKWSIIISSFSEKDFKTIIQIAPIGDYRKKMKWASYYLAHNQKEKALSSLDSIFKEAMYPPAMEMKANIYWQSNEKDKAIQIINKFKNDGYSGYTKIAQFYFTHNSISLALKTTREAIHNHYPLYHLEVFYLMSMNNYEEAIYLLEKYMQTQKMNFYQYGKLIKEYNKYGNKKIHWKALQKLIPKYPHLCKKAILLELNWKTTDKIIQDIQNCKVLNQAFQRREFLLKLDRIYKYKLIEKILLSNKIKKSGLEFFLLGKSIFMQNNKDIQKAIYYFKKSLNHFFIYKQEAKYFLAKSYIRQKKYKKAITYLKNLNFKDSVILTIWMYIYLHDWKTVQQKINHRNFYAYQKEKNFFMAIWSIQKNQLKQAEILLEKYIEDPNLYGNKAVYILFLLKYFPQELELQKFIKILSVYPSGIQEKDWQPLHSFLKKDIDTEFSNFVKFWHIRYLLMNHLTYQAKLELNILAQKKQIELLSSQIQYLRLKLENYNKKEIQNYLFNFPDSPYRINIEGVVK